MLMMERMWSRSATTRLILVASLKVQAKVGDSVHLPYFLYQAEQVRVKLYGIMVG